jgi:hypothetical protein
MRVVTALKGWFVIGARVAWLEVNEAMSRNSLETLTILLTKFSGGTAGRIELYLRLELFYRET